MRSDPNQVKPVLLVMEGLLGGYNAIGNDIGNAALDGADPADG